MALYGYQFQLPKGLNDDQLGRLKNLALTTARKASVVDKGRFKKGWTVLIKGSKLVVQSKVPYAIYVERGLGYNKHNRYKVRDALNKIGFERMYQGETGSLTVPAAGVAGKPSGKPKGTASATASGSDSPQKASSTLNTAQVAPIGSTIQSLNLSSISSPSALRKELQNRVNGINRINSNPILDNQSYFDTNSLLALLAAAIAVNEGLKEEESNEDN